MQKKYIKALELDKILLMLKNEAICTETKNLIDNINSLSEINEIKNSLLETNTMLSFIVKYGNPRISKVSNALNICDRATKGGVLSFSELLLIGSTLRNYRNLKEWYEQSEEEINVLDNMFNAIIPQPQLEKNIFESIISDTEMADTASSALYDIRRKIKQTEFSIKDKLDTLIKSQSNQKYLQDNIVSIRSGRFVVPVKQEHKGDIQGVIHDVSSTGSTIFVEPTAVVEANAKILQLQNMEKEEIHRILEAFSSQVASIEYSFKHSYENMIIIDLIAAKAKLAIIQNSYMPIVESTKTFSLIKARHPLIDKSKVVPIDITLGEGYDTIVVTGPNTGGKTVTLKTVGLLSAMIQYGLLIPADPQSKICLYKDILVDIGDEQSIEQSLSTFSGHIKNISEIINEANADSLVLLDELGSGTDPAEGAALAVSIIEYLRNTKTHIMATTHYGEMKIYALETDGVQNASCEFNIETLRPTYKINLGIPGKSNAFLISEKLGLSNKIIENAKKQLSQDDMRFNVVLNELEDLKIEQKVNKQQIEDLKNIAEIELKKAKQKRDDLIKQGEKELELMREKAKELVNSVQNKAYNLMDEMKLLQKSENLSAQQKAQRAREIAKKDSEKIYKDTNTNIEKKVNLYPIKTAKKGDKVYVISLNQNAIITASEDRNGMVAISMGMIKTKVHISDLSEIKETNKIKTKYVPKPSMSSNREQVRSSSMEINLLGLNVDEATMEVDSFIDNAIMCKYNFIYLIHGKGTGALRKGLHEYLKRHKCVKNFRLGAYGEGESGVTVVELK